MSLGRQLPDVRTMIGLKPSSTLLLQGLFVLVGCTTDATIGMKPGGGDTQGAATGGATTSVGDASATDGEEGAEGPVEGTAGDAPSMGSCETFVPDSDEALASWVFHCTSEADLELVGSGTDAQGNVYLGFDLREVFEFRTAILEVGGSVLESGGLSEIVMVKLDPDGQVVWARMFGGPQDDYPVRFVACDDRLLLTGSTPESRLDLGQGPLEHPDFLASFDLDGQLQWARSFAVTGEQAWVRLNDMACDADGNVVAVGDFREDVNLGNGTLTAELTDGFVASYDPAGDLRWVQTFEGEVQAETRPRRVVFTPDGDVVTVGWFGGTIEVGDERLSSSEGEDVFVARYDSSGQAQWGRSFGPEGLQYGFGLAVADDGSLGVTGTFLDTIDFDGTVFENVFPDAVEDEVGTLYDVFVAKLEPQGQLEWVRAEATMLDDQVFGQVFGPSGALFVLNRSSEGLDLHRYLDGEALAPVRLTTSGGSVKSDLTITPGGQLVVGTSVGGDAPSFAGVGLSAPGIVAAKLDPPS